MKQIETSTGFSCNVNELAADDIEFLDLLCDLDDGEIKAYRKVLKKLLSDDDIKRLFDHVRTEDGRVPVSAISAELVDIIKSLGKK